MNIFKGFKDELNYKNILQLDSAFSGAHLNYDKPPIFNEINSKNLTEGSKKNSLPSKEKFDNVIEYMYLFDGTQKNLNKNDRVLIWKNYWLEYIKAFDKLHNSLPDSIVTIYVGRQAVEIGFKYLLLKNDGEIIKTHDLAELSNLLVLKYNINDKYMDGIHLFCEKFCKYIEGENSEYFRYPEYQKNTYFDGNRLDIEWLSYNFILILLKLIHFANMDNEL